jgi:hypothetical protein
MMTTLINPAVNPYKIPAAAANRKPRRAVTCVRRAHQTAATVSTTPLTTRTSAERESAACTAVRVSSMAMKRDKPAQVAMAQPISFGGGSLRSRAARTKAAKTMLLTTIGWISDSDPWRRAATCSANAAPLRARPSSQLGRRSSFSTRPVTDRFARGTPLAARCCRDEPAPKAAAAEHARSTPTITRGP